MFRYDWYKSGYVEEKPNSFDTPINFCLQSGLHNPNCVVCLRPAFVTCAWCKKSLCFKHFYTEYHYCNHYDP
ncbi:hypothetical protein ANTQUA_LOCUS8956 [Anthophora quadrimaculata]